MQRYARNQPTNYRTVSLLASFQEGFRLFMLVFWGLSSSLFHDAEKHPVYGDNWARWKRWALVVDCGSEK